MKIISIVSGVLAPFVITFGDAWSVLNVGAPYFPPSVHTTVTETLKCPSMRQDAYSEGELLR